MEKITGYFIAFVAGAILIFFVSKFFDKKNISKTEKKIEELIKENEELLKKIKKEKKNEN